MTAEIRRVMYGRRLCDLAQDSIGTGIHMQAPIKNTGKEQTFPVFLYSCLKSISLVYVYLRFAEERGLSGKDHAAAVKLSVEHTAAF